MDTQRQYNNYNPYVNTQQLNGNNTMTDRYGNEYGISDNDFAKVAENRSLHGNFVDNALAYDPNKDNKSVYDVVFASDVYDPWGKPGGGAPIIDRNTGRLRTKIEGRLQWNLNGLTNSAKARKSRDMYKAQPNLLEFRKSPSPLMKLPLNYEATTYRSVYGGIDNNNSIQQMVNRNVSPDKNNNNSNMNNNNINNSPTNNNTNYKDASPNRFLKTSNQNYNFNSNDNIPQQPPISPRKYDYQENSMNGFNYNNFNNNGSNGNRNINTSNGYLPSIDNTYRNNNSINASPYNNNVIINDTGKAYDYGKWFGNNVSGGGGGGGVGGGGAPSNDARRKKLLDMLENRHVYDPNYSKRSQSDLLFAKSTIRSSHKNMFDAPT